MFVLPPPPKFPVGSPAYAAALAQMKDNNLDAHNTLKFLEGPEYSFLTGEGQYTLREDIHLATPPPHPSEIPILNPNPLSTAPIAVTAGVKLSLCNISYKEPASGDAIFRIGTNNFSIGGASSIRSREYDDNLSELGSLSRTFTSDLKSNNLALTTSISSSGLASVDLTTETSNNTLSTILSNASYNPPSKDGRKRKPKNNMAKSNSSFVSRITPHEHQAKRLSERSSEDLYYFANLNRSFNWMDFATPSMKLQHEPMAKILFTKSHPISHDVNQFTKGSQHIDVAIGFSSSDIIWFEPMSIKYNRLNKNGTINDSAVTEIKWIPGSENLFFAAHMNGSIVIYDKEREDSNFAEELNNGNFAELGNKEFRDGFKVIKSIASNQRGQRHNPVAYWKVSHRPITAFAISPNSQYIAIVSEDGYLKIIDIAREKLLDVFSSYYGGFLCVCWSPDGRYILTGGQDDLVSIWSFSSRALVARCQGHQSFVRSVAFDPWRCDDRVYRFGSVGEDCRLLLWDFSVKSLHRPRGGVHRSSISSHNSRSAYDRQSLLSTHGHSDSNAIAYDEDEAYHPTATKASIPIIPPVLSKVVDPDPLSWIAFREDCIIIACHTGHIRTWNRPHVRSTEGIIHDV
ncbi:WD40-repeat-containing domain protein [Lipomyces japonicus]|uniref:WD40-repeat-containing domain protein n=1 Tax=Lipomyces japonicus TaxID=56871 RepID=UPI0034CD20F3